MKTVLVLDDESVLLKLLGAVLKRHYNIIEATTAEQALCLFNAHGRQVDLLVADLSLPKSSGIQVALLLRLAIPHLPVILTSGYPTNVWSAPDSADLERLGSTLVAIIQKPFQSQMLLKAVRGLIGAGTSETANCPNEATAKGHQAAT